MSNTSSPYQQISVRISLDDSAVRCIPTAVQFSLTGNVIARLCEDSSQ